MKKTLSLLALMAMNPVHASEWQDMLNAAKQAASPQTKEKINQLIQKNLPKVQAQLQNGQPLPAGDLTTLLMQRTGVTQTQAQGGLGALLQVAKARMQAGEFAQLEQSIPNLQGLLNAVPVLQQPSTLGSLARVAGNSGSIGDLLTTARVFKQLGMSPTMVQQFIPMLLGYVQTAQGESVAKLLSTALVNGQLNK